MKPINKKREKIIYILFFFSLVIIFCFYSYSRFFQKKEASFVVIKQNGKIIKALPIEKSADLLVKSALGQNRVTIKNGSVKVTYADCPDKVCIMTTPITKDNASTTVIVCLPHKLVISLEK